MQKYPSPANQVIWRIAVEIAKHSTSICISWIVWQKDSDIQLISTQRNSKRHAWNNYNIIYFSHYCKHAHQRHPAHGRRRTTCEDVPSTFSKCYLLQVISFLLIIGKGDPPNHWRYPHHTLHTARLWSGHDDQPGFEYYNTNTRHRIPKCASIMTQFCDVFQGFASTNANRSKTKKLIDIEVSWTKAGWFCVILTDFCQGIAG